MNGELSKRDRTVSYSESKVISMTKTYILGHILDVLCVRDTFSGTPYKFRQVNTQKNCKINITDLRESILNSDLIKHPHRAASLLSHQYFNTLLNILNNTLQSKGKKHHCTLTKAL